MFHNFFAAHSGWLFLIIGPIAGILLGLVYLLVWRLAEMTFRNPIEATVSNVHPRFFVMVLTLGGAVWLGISTMLS
jgi:hypothetical protein